MFFASGRSSEDRPLEHSVAPLGDFDLIVTCEECSTSFQLDEARIPVTGARVRCSRCKHAFFLPSPTASPAEAVHSVAEQAAHAPAASVPAAAEDLSAQAGAVPAEPSTASSDSGSVLDEEDWQFSEEVRVEGDDDLSDESDSEEESVFGVSQDFGEGFDASALSADSSATGLATPAAEGPPIAREAAADAGSSSGLELDGVAPDSEPVRDESSFGSVDDFSALMEDEEPSVVGDLASEIASELEAEEANDSSVGTYAEAGTTDDLGDPESWDLVGHDDFAGGPGSIQGVSRSFSSATGIESVDAGDFFSEDALAGSAYDDDLTGSSIMAGPVGHVVRFLGWGVTLGLVGAIVFYSLGSEWARWAEAPQIVRAGSLEAETISSGWVETSRSGSVLRIAGQIRNTGAEPIWPARVQLALLDGSGARLTAPPIQAGLPLPETVLREAPLEALEERRARATERLASSPLAPGETREFEALLLEGRLPESAERVLLEVGPPVSPSRNHGAGAG